jgi:pyruvate formate lyase activating enzyme
VFKQDVFTISVWMAFSCHSNGIKTIKMPLNKSEYEKKYCQPLKPPLISWDICCEVHHRKKIPDLPIGGFLKQSLIDFPGYISAIVFTAGCNFRCSYCHNTQLVLPDEIRKAPKYDVSELLEWISKNKKMLDAVVVTGGEPTLHKKLPDFLELIKNMDMKVKLDTNGTNPDMLCCLIDYQLVDYVAMDIKVPLEYDRYKEIAGHLFNRKMFESINRSVERLKKGDISHEFRTTLASELSIVDLRSIADIADTNYYIQQLREPGIGNIVKNEISIDSLNEMIRNHPKKEFIHVR